MQINRLFQIVYMLLDKRNITAGSLAEHFEVSQRTIYRDVEILSAAGIPVCTSKGKGGGISLLPDFVLNKAVLTEPEKADILAALRAVSLVSPTQTDTALQKLSTLFGETCDDWIEVDFSSWENGGVETDLWGRLKAAVQCKSRVEFIYSASSGETAQRRVEPLKLCFKGQGWYLYGYCMAKQGFRFFKLRRMKNLEVIPESFTRTAPARIFAEEYSFGSSLVTITMRLSSELAFRAYDEFENIQKLEDGSFIVGLAMPREYVHQYIASFGYGCELLEPSDIRSEVIEKLKKTLEDYL